MVIANNKLNLFAIRTSVRARKALKYDWTQNDKRKNMLQGCIVIFIRYSTLTQQV